MGGKWRAQSESERVIQEKRNMEVSENRGTLFWGPYNKDPTI